MKRRQFITMLGGTAAAWPLAARAQQLEATPRIGVLTTLADKDFEGQLRVAAFRQELQKIGWIEGRNIRFEYRWAAGDAQRLRAYAHELVGMAPSVILGGNNTALRALQEVTHTVPIVFAQVADPVGSGFVASLARPGGNITGFALYEPAIAVKWLELLKEIAPSIARVGIIYDPTDFNSKHIQEIEALTASVGVQLSSFIVRNVSDIERASMDSRFNHTAD
jgi:putative ABC transport system substrate-binding protein